MERVGGVVEAEEEVGSGAGDGREGAVRRRIWSTSAGAVSAGWVVVRRSFGSGRMSGRVSSRVKRSGVEPEGEAARGGPASAERGELAGLESDFLRGAVVDAPAGGFARWG